MHFETGDDRPDPYSATDCAIHGYTIVYPLDTLSDMKTKDVGLRIRLERDLRDAFVDACRAHDRPAAQVLREFIRDFVARHPTPSHMAPKKRHG